MFKLKKLQSDKVRGLRFHGDFENFEGAISKITIVTDSLPDILSTFELRSDFVFQCRRWRVA